MKSGTIRPEDRVVWVGDPEVLVVGSSVKAYEVTRTHVGVEKLGGTYEERQRGDLEWYRRGTQFVSCEEAARRKIEPWYSSLPPSMGGTYVRDPSAPRKTAAEVLDIFSPIKGPTR
jgi:hypothetical protein